jgi:putative FmdB family regulatory protein
MPTYDYLCEKGHEFAVVQSIKDDALTVCTITEPEKCTAGNYQPPDGKHNPHFDAYDEYPTCRYCGTAITWCDAPCKRQIGATSFKFKGGAPTPKHYG